MKILKIASGLLAAALAVSAQQYTISTVAGIGGDQADYGDGTLATQAGVYNPIRVAVDSKGNYYIVELLGQTIREVTASNGFISQFAGTGTYGFQGDNGPAYQAQLSDVHGICVDSSGNVYISDTGNSRIREIYSSNGNINTIAGNGTFGFAGDGGAATNAELGRPGALAVDSAGNVYVPDYAFSVVRKIDSKGNITTIAGTGVFGNSGDGGPASKALLGSPVAVAVDAAGNVYISDSNSASIREITAADGNIHTILTNVDAQDLKVDAGGNLYYPNYQHSTINKILPSGAQTVIAGNGVAGWSGDGNLATNAELSFPYGLALDQNNKIYVADTNNQVIRLLSPVSSPLTLENAASGLYGAVAAGEIVVIYGTGLGPAATVVNQPVNGVYSSSLAGTSVTFDGSLAPILYTSATQVAAIVPYQQSADSTATVAVTYNGNTVTGTNPTAVANPGIFTLGSIGSGQAAAVNLDGTINGPAHPARVGSFVSLYVTGEGYTNPTGQNGFLTNPASLPHPVLPVYVFLNGQRCFVTYAGEAPDEVAGLMQVNIQIPPLPAALLLNSPVNVPVVVQVGDFPSQTNVTLSISN